MSFEPCSAEHAIDEVEFVFVCDREFSDADINAIRRLRNLVRAELPAISSLDDEPSIRFGYLRPNGSPVWQLRVSGNGITIQCTRYTRWARVWERALSYANFVIGACVEVAPLQIEGMGLNVTDSFEAVPEESELQTLFVKSDLVPSSLFDRKSVWACDQRWYDVSPYGALGVRIDISARRVRRFERSTGETNLIAIVSIEHSQELAFNNELVGTQEGRELSASAGDAMGYLHEENKQLIDRLLVEEMKGKIGLWRGA